MTFKHADNQIAVAKVGGIPPLIELLEGNPEVHREVAGALWSLASSTDNQVAIAKSGGILGGIPPLVGLLKTGSRDAQETVAGAALGHGRSPEWTAGSLQYGVCWAVGAPAPCPPRVRS